MADVPAPFIPGGAYGYPATSDPQFDQTTHELQEVFAFVLPVENGGTESSTFTNHGVLVGHLTSPVTATSPGNIGEVLTSNGTALDPTFQTSPSSPFAVISPGIAGVVGNGSASDTVAIQAIITANPGKTIYVLAPTVAYMIQGVNVPANTKILCTLGALFRKNANGDFFATAGDNVEIEGGIWDCNSPTFTGHGILGGTGFLRPYFNKLRIINSGQSSINAIRSHGVKIIDCDCDGGIIIYGTIGQTIRGGTNGSVHVYSDSASFPVIDVNLDGFTTTVIDNTVDFAVTVQKVSPAAKPTKIRIAGVKVALTVGVDGYFSLAGCTNVTGGENHGWLNGGSVTNVGFEIASCDGINLQGGSFEVSGYQIHSSTRVDVGGYHTYAIPTNPGAGTIVYSDEDGPSRDINVGPALFTVPVGSNGNGVLVEVNHATADINNVNIHDIIVDGPSATAVALRTQSGVMSDVTIDNVRGDPCNIGIEYGVVTRPTIRDCAFPNVGSLNKWQSGGAPTNSICHDNSWNNRTTIPTNGTDPYAFVGERFNKTNVAALGTPGWICTTAGTTFSAMPSLV